MVEVRCESRIRIEAQPQSRTRPGKRGAGGRGGGGGGGGGESGWESAGQGRRGVGQLLSTWEGAQHNAVGSAQRIRGTRSMGAINRHRGGESSRIKQRMGGGRTQSRQTARQAKGRS